MRLLNAVSRQKKERRKKVQQESLRHLTNVRLPNYYYYDKDWWLVNQLNILHVDEYFCMCFVALID